MAKVAVLLALFAGVSHFALTQTAQSDLSKAPTLDHFDTKNVDPSVDPCADFYLYSCKKWIAKNPAPPDEPFWAAFVKLELWNRVAVYQTLIDLSKKPESQRTALEKQVGDYWNACNDMGQRNLHWRTTLEPQLKTIDSMQEKAQLAEVLAAIHRIMPYVTAPNDSGTHAPVFGISAQPDFHNTQMVLIEFDQGGLLLPTPDFYLKDDAKSVEIRDKYLSHLQRVFELLGVPEKPAKENANTVLQMETTLAKVSMDMVKRRDPKNLDNEMGLEQVKQLVPSFNWEHYLTGLHAPASPKYIVTSPEFFRGFEQLIQSEPLDHWKTYLKLEIVEQFASNLNDEMVREDFNFYSRVLYGAKEMRPLWRRCVKWEDQDIGEALGQAYVARYFPPESKARVQKMVKDIEAALNQDFDDVSWMSPDTRKYAHKKLAAQIDKIAYPDHWRDYSSIEIVPDNHLLNVERSATFELNRQLQKVGQPVDRTEWQMTPPTVNAYEDPQTNTINFPAGILQPPYFDANMDDAVNYGALGSVIGHETTHGFDDQGRKFDALGNLTDWWTPADAKAYEQRGDCIAQEYTEEVPELGVKTNGRLTQGEDTGDNGGARLALAALAIDLKAKGESLDSKGTDGNTPLQRFFLSYANMWCANPSTESLRTQVLSNPHSMTNYRVNNVVANMPEFAHAFGCHKGQAMVHENACRVW